MKALSMNLKPLKSSRRPRVANVMPDLSPLNRRFVISLFHSLHDVQHISPLALPHVLPHAALHVGPHTGPHAALHTGPHAAPHIDPHALPHRPTHATPHVEFHTAPHTVPHVVPNTLPQFAHITSSQNPRVSHPGGSSPTRQRACGREDVIVARQWHSRLGCGMLQHSVQHPLSDSGAPRQSQLDNQT